MPSKTYATPSVLKKLCESGPFSFIISDEEISNQIREIHDPKSTKFDVYSLYNVLEKIIKNSNAIGELIEHKRVVNVVVVEDELPKQNVLVPPASTLEEISFQMRCECKSFDMSTLHQTVMEILEKLRDYNWDAKAIIALAAFALVYGQCLYVVSSHGDEVHTFRVGGMESSAYFNGLVELALQVVRDIIELEELIAEVQSTSAEDPIPRDIYTYWATFAILACASQRDNEADVMTLKLIQLYLNFVIDDCRSRKGYFIRLKIFRNPSGNRELLSALISPQNQDPKLYNIALKIQVSPDELKTKHLLLFISGLEEIEDDIVDLKPIDDAFKTDQDKHDYMILWIPVVDYWTENQKKKFEDLEFLMPWNVVHDFPLTKGIRLLKEEWGYKDKPMVVVTNPRGKVINKNAIRLIYRYKIDAFPFRPEDEAISASHWRWFWNEVGNFDPLIQKWVYGSEYIFLYGGTNKEMIKSLRAKVNSNTVGMEMKPYNMEQVKQYDMGVVNSETAAKFWSNIASFQDKIVNDRYGHVHNNVRKILSMKDREAWLLLSEGPNVLVVDDYKLWL